MKRKPLLFLSVLLAAVLLIGPTNVGAHEEEVNKDVKLTQSQQVELGALYKDLFDKHKQIIDKYVEYGVFSNEKAAKIVTHMEERQAKLKENGYIPKWDRKHHGKMKHQKTAE